MDSRTCVGQAAIFSVTGVPTLSRLQKNGKEQAEIPLWSAGEHTRLVMIRAGTLSTKGGIYHALSVNSKNSMAQQSLGQKPQAWEAPNTKARPEAGSLPGSG